MHKLSFHKSESELEQESERVRRLLRRHYVSPDVSVLDLEAVSILEQASVLIDPLEADVDVRVHGCRR